MKTFKDLKAGDSVYLRAFSTATFNWYYDTIHNYVYTSEVDGVIKKYLGNTKITNDNTFRFFTDNRLNFEAYPDDSIYIVDLDNTRRLIYATEESLLDDYLKKYMKWRLDRIADEIENLEEERKVITEKLNTL